MPKMHGLSPSEFEEVRRRVDETPRGDFEGLVIFFHDQIDMGPKDIENIMVEYFSASERQREIMDNMMISIIGWSIPSLFTKWEAYEEGR